MHIVLSNNPEDNLSVLGVSLSLTGEEVVSSDGRPILFSDYDDFLCCNVSWNLSITRSNFDLFENSL